jgi:iron complex outermembrane receptor protein
MRRRLFVPHAWSFRSLLTSGVFFTLVAAAAAEPPEAPSGYGESIETPGSVGGEEDEVDAGEAQAESSEATGGVPGVSRRQARAVEEIVVQARKREELLEDTPVSVTALSETALRESGVQRLDDIQILVPNLTFQLDNTGAATNIRIRGVGTSTTEIAFDPGVGVYVDGVYLPRSLGTLVDIVDVQQIEVLRGPQGTLFGKNTVGGAINITTVKPTQELEGFAMVRPGNFDRVDTRFMLNAPVRVGWLDDRLFARFAFASTNTPGYVFNVTRDESLNGHNSVALLGTLRFLPHEDVTIDLTGTWSRDHNNGIGQQCVVARRDGALAPFLPPGALEDCEASRPFETRAGVDTITDLEDYGTWLVASWDVGEVPWLGDISVKSLSSWRQQRPRTRFDVDQTSFQIIQLSTVGGSILDGSPGFQRQFMEEGQLNGSTLDGRLNYVAGAFGFWEDGDGGDRTTWVLPPGQGNPLFLNQLFFGRTTIDNWTWALYGQATYDILDWLSLTGGIRYTQDKKGLTFEQFNLISGEQTGNEAGNRVFEKWTPMASIAATVPEDLLDETPLDHVMGYFTFAQGFKGGGFNGVTTGQTGPTTGVAFAYGPETLDNFEIGFKLIGFEQRATLNTSFYYGEYDDIQVTQIRDTGLDESGAPTIARVTDNAAKGTTKGFEIEMQANPIEGLLATGSVGYVDAVYDDFADALSDFDGTEIDRSGDRFLFTPRLQTFLSVQYSFPLPGLEGSSMEGWLTPRLEWAYQSSVEWLGPEVPQATQRGYNLLNARFSYDFLDDRAQVALWAENLLDQAYFNNVTPIVSVVGFVNRNYAAPRTFGAELSWKF